MADFPKYYILNGRAAIRSTLMGWARWFETGDRHVADDIIGEVRVSTVFLGLDHRHFGDGPPLIFETMIFRGKHDGYQNRSSTWDEAVQQHAEALALVRESSAHEPRALP